MCGVKTKILLYQMRECVIDARQADVTVKLTPFVAVRETVERVVLTPAC